MTQPWAVALPPSESVAIWTHEVGRRLAARGHDVVVYANGHGASETDLHADGVEYRLLPTVLDWRLLKLLEPLARRRGSNRPAFASRLYFLEYALRVARELRRAPADVVHVHNFSQFVPILRRAGRARQIVLHMHCEWLSVLYRRMVARRLRSASVVLGCSEFITARVRDAFPELGGRARTLYNGVDVDLFSPGEVRDGAGGPVRFAAVGRISPEKGTHRLLEAFEALVAREPEVELDLVGPVASVPPAMLIDLYTGPLIDSLQTFREGPYLDRVRAILSPFAAAKVRFGGKVDHDELAARYREMDVLVSASLAESFGLPLIEAMASGVPVVATTAGGMAEVVRDGLDGLAVPPDDAQALAAAMLRLARDPDLRRRLGEEGRRSAVQRFSWDRVADQALACYATTDC